MMVIVVAGVLGTLTAPEAPLSVECSFEVRDFSGDLQIMEEESLKTKFKVIHRKSIIILSPEQSHMWIIMALKILRYFSSISFQDFTSSTLPSTPQWVLCVE